MKVRFLQLAFGLIFLLVVISSSFPVRAAAADFDKIRTYIEQGKWEQAIQELNEILAINPESAKAHFLLGQVYKEKVELFLDMAIKEYEKALRDEETRFLAQKELARIWLDKEEYEKVMVILSDLEEEKQSQFEVLKLLGLAYFGWGRLTEALEKLERAQSLKPYDAEVIFSLGEIYEDKQLFEEALTSYRKILSLPAARRLAKIAQERIQSIEQERIGLTVADIEDPQVREIIFKAPGAEEYPEAGAIVLLNERDHVIREDNTMVEKVHKLIKVLNVRGREKYGEIHIDYDSTYEAVEVDYARTIEPDGSIVKVGKKDIRDIDKWAGFPLYSNAKVKVISMPEVMENSIIEYQATIFTSKLINEDDFQFSWEIKEFEPYLRHRFRLTIPEGRAINIHYVRLKDQAPQITQINNSLTYEWKIDNISEIVAEPSMPPRRDISPSIMVSSFSSWEEFSQWWRGLTQGQPEPNPAISGKVRELTEGRETQKDKAKAIYQWVASKIRYVGLEFGIAGFKPHSAEEVFNNKYGDCKDKATLLLAMYKAAGIPAYYALIGTREIGKLEKDIPMSQFNHAIVLAEIEGNLVWMDPTAETASYGDIPGADQEKLALVFFPEAAQFSRVPLQEPDKNRMETAMRIDINPDASIDVELELLASGASAMGLRTLKYVKPAQRQQIVENWIDSMAPGAKLKSYHFSDLEDLSVPVKLTATYSAPDYLKKTGDVWLFTTPGVEIDVEIVGKEKRTYPIVFSTSSLSVDKAEIHLPPDFYVQYLPENVRLELSYASFKSSYREVDGTIFYQGFLQRKETEIDRAQYPEYKFFREEAARESQKPIIIKS